jgi:hypothetical protein
MEIGSLRPALALSIRNLMDLGSSRFTAVADPGEPG